MKWKYTLAPEAARDLVQIWRYVQKQGSWETADRVESMETRGQTKRYTSYFVPVGGETPCPRHRLAAQWDKITKGRLAQSATPR